MEQIDELKRLLCTDKWKSHNIVISGMPGSGKSTTGKALSRATTLAYVDVDEYLEETWKDSVAHILSTVGDEGFIEKEGTTVLKLNPEQQTIISLSGSNVLHEAAMKHLRSKAVVVYIDVEVDDILARLGMMKVDRIVGMNEKLPDLRQVMQYRNPFYNNNYDVRALIPLQSSAEQVFEIVVASLVEYLQLQGNSDRLFRSTRSDLFVSFEQAVVLGLSSDDGGLFVPTFQPTITPSQFSRLASMNSFEEIACYVLERWTPTADPAVLRKFVFKAYSSFHHTQRAPMKSFVHNGGHVHLLELFHGPTASFKDFALQLFPLLFDHCRNRLTSAKPCILVATSGDTGSATVDGFIRHTDIPCVCLYPKDGVSKIQERQMTSFDAPDRLHLLAVDQADFDFCQTSVKATFQSQSLKQQLHDKGYFLSAANSINWGRLLPQIVFHTFSYCKLLRTYNDIHSQSINVVVPTGNFGNVLAAYYSAKSGVAFSKLICASNANDVVTEFLRTGIYDVATRSLIKTSSPSIDILRSSNLERLLYHVCGARRVATLFDQLASTGTFELHKQELAHVQDMFAGASTTEQQTQSTIESIFNLQHTLLDPHSAVAVHVATEQVTSAQHVIVCCTAHWSKFPDIVLAALNLTSAHATSLLDKVKLISKTTEQPIHPGVEKCLLSSLDCKKICQPSLEDIHSSLLSFLK